jgi:uncharacterized membrane protein
MNLFELGITATMVGVIGLIFGEMARDGLTHRTLVTQHQDFTS